MTGTYVPRVRPLLAIVLAPLAVGALLSVGASGCGARRIDAVGFTPEAPEAGSPGPVVADPIPDAGADEPPAFQTVDATTTPPADPNKFFIIVSESPASPSPSEGSGTNWGGLFRQDILADNAAATPGNGIDKSSLHDPLGLAFRKKSAEVFVGNRHGNVGDTGISRFLYDADTESFTPTGTLITTPGLVGIHQITFNAEEDEIFAGTNNRGLYRFKLDSGGNWNFNGQLLDGAWIRGLSVSPDGKRLYASTASNIILTFDLTAPGTPELPRVTVPSSTASGQVLMHYMWRADLDLYVGTFSASVIMHFKIDPVTDDLTLADMIPAPNSPSGVALSPDGQEMFALGTVNSSQIQRFSLTNGSWTPTTTINATTSNMGCALVFPAAARPTEVK